VAIVAIASLSQLGGWTDALFRGTIRTGQSGPALTANSTNRPAIPPVASGNSSLPAVPSSGLFSGSLPPQRLYEFTLANGRTLRIPFSDPAQIPETSGGSGMTYNAALAMEAVITQLEKMPEADPALIASLRELAKRGHDIREAQFVIESKLRNQTFADENARNTFMNETRVDFQGENLTLMQLATYTSTYGSDTTSGAHRTRYQSGSQVDFMTSLSDYVNSAANNLILNGNSPTSELFTSNKLLLNFVEQYQSIQSSGLLNDPVLKQLIGDNLSRQIFISSVSTKYASNSEDLNKLVGITRVNANGICDLSNANDCKG
jgi:hypothetical protein